MVTIHPVTAERWDDLAQVFGPNGARGSCWCVEWRLTSGEFSRSAPPERRETLQNLVMRGEPVGLLAYLDGRPVGWCSVAPVSQYGRLVRSKTLPYPEEPGAWALTCFFMRAGFRRQGLSKALLKAAIDYVQPAGAPALYAYPHRTAERVPSYSGSIWLYHDAEFEEMPSHSTATLVMRRQFVR